MNLIQLRYFVTVAQLENMSRAAELLYLSQSSLSKSIAKMEAELGMPLFLRSGKKITLNLQGERFLECSNRVLREIELALDDMNMMSNGNNNKIKLGIAGCASKIIDCVSAFKKEHPGSDFDFDFNIESIEHVDINDYDALIYPEGVKYGKLVGCPFGEEKYSLAVPKSHFLSTRPVITAKNLSNQDFVFLHKGKFFMEFSYRVCTALNIPFSSLNFTDTRQSHAQIIASGMAVGFVPDGAASAYANPDICLIPIEDKRFSRSMMICFRRKKHLSPLAQDFKNYVTQQFNLKVVEPSPL